MVQGFKLGYPHKWMHSPLLQAVSLLCDLVCLRPVLLERTLELSPALKAEVVQLAQFVSHLLTLKDFSSSPLHTPWLPRAVCLC